MEDNHIFGESDYLNGNDYAVGAVVQVKVVSFMGRLEFVNRDGETERAGYYKVKNPEGSIKEFRLGVANEKILKNQFKCGSYLGLIGKTLFLIVKKYQFGNGFVVSDLKLDSLSSQTRSHLIHTHGEGHADGSGERSV